MKHVYIATVALLLVMATTLFGCVVPYPEDEGYGDRGGYRDRDEGRHHDHHDEGRGARHDQRRGDDEEHHR